MSNHASHRLASILSTIFAVACLSASGLAHAQRPTIFQSTTAFGSTTTHGQSGTHEQSGTHGQSGGHGQAGAQHGQGAQYLLVTMRGGASLQGSQMNQLRKQGGTSLRLVQSDGAGNYLMQVQKQVSAAALNTLVTQLKSNANVLSATPATVGSKLIMAKVGDSISETAADLMASTPASTATGSTGSTGTTGTTGSTATTSTDQWHQVAGQAITLANATSDTLAFTVPQITTDNGDGTTGSTTGTNTGSGATAGTNTGSGSTTGTRIVPIRGAARAKGKVAATGWAKATISDWCTPRTSAAAVAWSLN